MAKKGEVIHCETDGVFIHTTVAQADEDALVGGKIFIKSCREGTFIEWKPYDELESGNRDSSGWTMIDNVSYKPDAMQEAGTVSINGGAKKTKSHKYVINFDIKDLKSFKRSLPKLGWSYIIFILRDGSTYPALHFHKGGTKNFVKEMEKHLLIKKSPSDECLYLVREQDPQALSKSFDELQLFQEEAGHMLNKFINDPVHATMGGFSRVTNYLFDKVLAPEEVQRPQDDGLLQMEDELDGMAIIQDTDEPEYEMITTRELPARQEVFRGQPLSADQWAKHMNKEGQITDVDKLKGIIFSGGVEPNIRVEVWKYLLGYYSWDSTHASRTEHRKRKVDDYFRMKLQWKSISADQERRFSQMRERKALVDKDVVRTDRTHKFYEGDNNANVATLYDILMTYCMYNFDLGYVQGMSDLLSPILLIMENEVDAFWCFAGFMELVCHNFEMDQAGMKRQLHEVNLLVRFTDIQLSNYLESHESSNMYFCFRWLLVVFKREFSFNNIMRLWEVYWTGLPCKNFHLLLCLAILDTEKNTLIENNFGFTEILKCINDLSMKIDLDQTLKKAEAIYNQIEQCSDLPEKIQSILGFTSENSDASSSSTPEHNACGAKHSGKDTLMQQQSLHAINGTASNDSSAGNRQSHHNGLHAVTPDDNSIEILPDNMDLVM